MQNKTPSQLEMDGVPSFYIGIYGVCTHRMGHLDIPVWCKDADSVLIAMNLINNYQQPKTEPKRWTIADQQAGRLPPAGSKYLAGTHNIELECLYNDSKGNAWGFDAQGEVHGFAINYCSPIETPEEKAERLKSEWCAKAAKQLKNLEYTSTLKSIYDALLSGELKTPTKGE